MVQVVFVHGVSTRDGPEYRLYRENRDALFKAAVFGEKASISSPLWGDDMPAFRGLSFDRQGVQSLSLATGLAAGKPSVDATETGVLPQLAAVSPATAVDLLFAERVARADAGGAPLTPKELQTFTAAVDLLDRGVPEDLASLAGTTSDSAFVKRLHELAKHPASLGMVDPLIEAARGIADRVRNTVSRGAYDAVLQPLNPMVGVFLGDVFRYLKDGPIRTAVRERVRKALQEAWTSARSRDEKLVLIGHSLGGVILYDLLSGARAAGLPDGFRADALVTVGSQPGLFQELGLFDHAPPAVPTGGTPGPPNVGQWLNAFDPIDPFGFRAGPMFNLPVDYTFDSVTGVVSAHTTYFARPQFYARLRRRLVDGGVLG